MNTKYGSAHIDFLDRTTNTVKKVVAYPVTRIELVDIDMENSTLDNVIYKKRTFIVRDHKWIEE